MAFGLEEGNNGFSTGGHDRRGFASRSLSHKGRTREFFSMNTQARRSKRSVLERGWAIYDKLKARGPKKLGRDAIVIFILLGVLYGGYLWFTLPDISDPKNLTAAQSSVILDKNGVELYRLYNAEDRVFVAGELIPKTMKDAIVAIEDRRFYDRGCIDYRAFARALFTLGQGGGASTLTRQLARNALDLKQEHVINRKIKEVILGCQLENRYSKEELLNLYLNWIPFGKNAYGIALAAKTYFNTDAKDLTLAEAAVLAALPQAPTYYSPYGKHVRTTVTPAAYQKILSGKITSASQLNDKDFLIGLLGNIVGTGSTTIYVGGRADQVLRTMQDLGKITEEERVSALSTLQTMKFEKAREDIRAAHFVLWVKSQVQTILGTSESIMDQGGLNIETTLDWNMQQAAEKAIKNKAEDIARLYSAQNIALVSVETGTNNILAYVGNTDYNDEKDGGKIDMAQSPRQPGSSFKPFVYGAAFEKGMSPATVLYDVPTKIGDDTPQNFDGTFWGMMTARRALAGSRNIPAAKAFFLGGGETGVLDFASRLGVTGPRDQKKLLSGSGKTFEYGWPLALGAGETPLTQMVTGYATYANKGIEKPLVSIVRIKDKRGNILYDASVQPAGVQVIDERVAALVTSVLSDVSARPNEFWQQVLTVPGFQAAAKTGTSNKCIDRAESGTCKDRRPLDLWTMGYTPNLITGIWIGNANSSPLSEKAEALNLAAPIWKDYMVRAHKLLKTPKANFDLPQGIVQPQVSMLSGELPTECTPIANRQSDLFLQEHGPTLQDPACVQLNVDRVTGLLASDECPAEAAEMRSFLSPKSVLAERFPEWDKGVQDWVKEQMKGYDPLTNTLGSGSKLPLPLAPTEKCTLSLTPGRMNKPTVSITFPTQGGGLPYPAFRPKFTVSSGSPLRQVEVFVDGKSVGVTVASPFDATVRVPRSVSKDGMHILKITITDQYFNIASDEVSFAFGADVSGPMVQLLQPQNGASVKSGDSIGMRADASDPAGIKYVEFFLDGKLLTTKPNEPYTLSYQVNLPAGTYTLKAVATDFSGNKAEDSVEVTVMP